MASPPESITTVNGRRCTRSRARTSATPQTSKDVVSSTRLAASTSTAQQQTSTAQAPPPPPPPPPPSSAVAAPPSSPPPSSPPPSSAPPPAPPPSQPAPTSTPVPSPEQAPEELPGTTTTPTVDPVAGPSSTGTPSTVPTSSSAPVEPLALPAPEPATAAVEPKPEAQATVEVPLQAPVVSAAPPTSPTPIIPSPTPTTPVPVPTSSDPTSIAVNSSPVQTPGVPALPTASPASIDPVSVNTNTPVPLQSDLDPRLSSTSPTTAQPQPTAFSVGGGFAQGSIGGSAGIIAPDQGSSNDDGPLTLNHNGNIADILGGVFGGIAALALISGLLFFCLKKRKSKPVRWDEKRQDDSSFLSKLKTIPTGLNAFVARLKGSQSGSSRNLYQRHVPKASVESVYSRDVDGRARSNSEPQGAFAPKRPGSNSSRSSKKSERNLLRKKPSSISGYRFPDIAEDTGTPNRFADPQQLHPLLLLNPDPKSTPAIPQVPAATADPESRDPFESVYDPPPAAQAWEKGSAHTHQRAMSSVSGQSSHTIWSLFPTNNPFRDPPNVPPLPNQAVLPQHHRQRSSMALPSFNPTTTFDANSTFATRDSGMYFGEPGPSRPATNMFTPVTPARRTIRQSDPFDLDRPEVLGFGGISRQTTRSKRSSSVSNWYSTAGGGATTPPPMPTASTKYFWGTNTGK